MPGSIARYSFSREEIEEMFQNIDLTAYATIEYVDQAISNLPGNTPPDLSLYATITYVDVLVAGKQPLDAALTSLSNLENAANKLVYFTGVDTFATTDLSSFGRSLIDDASSSVARTTLGLGSAATSASSDFDAAGAANTVQTNLNSHTTNTANPHATTAAQVGSYTTTQTDSAISTAVGAIDFSPYAPKASPALTGTPTAPTPATTINSTRLATTAFVQARIAEVIGTAPANLDTLEEISNQLASDESAVSALTTTVATKLAKASNLSDLTNAATARTNLGVTVFGDSLITSANAGAARTALGLGSAALSSSADFDVAGSASAVQTNLDTHTANVSNPHSVTAAQVGAYSTAATDTLLATKLSIASNLSDLANPVTARTNLGLGSAAIQASTAFDTAGAATAVQTNLDTHTADVSNPHSTTKAQVGLGSVENTALSTWAGTANITTLGTIVTGVWHGTAIADTYISSAATWNAKQDALGFTAVPTTRTVNGHALSANVSVTASDIGLGSVENTALSTWAGTANITTLGTIATGTWSATTIALNKGGTGQTTKAAAFDALSPMSASGDLIYGGTAGTGTRLAKGTDGQVLTLASGLPTWAAATGGSGAPIDDGTAIVKGSADATKLLRFEVDGFTTATTRVLTPPNADGTIAVLGLAQTWSAKQTFSAGVTLSGSALQIAVGTTAYAATVTPNCDSYNRLDVGTLTGNITFANPTGTPVNGQKLELRTVQDGTGGRTYSWGTNYAFGDVPSSSDIVTTASKIQIMVFEYDSNDSKWWFVGISRR